MRDDRKLRAGEHARAFSSVTWPIFYLSRRGRAQGGNILLPSTGQDTSSPAVERQTTSRRMIPDLNVPVDLTTRTWTA